MYYYGLSRNQFTEVVKIMMHLAKDEVGCDAFSAMNIMDNDRETFKELNFLNGDGCLHWYLVNWSLGENVIEPKDIGTLLI